MYILFEMLIGDIIRAKGELPACVHGDCAPVYQTTEVKQLLAEHGIEESCSMGPDHGNNAVESFNHAFKTRVIIKLLENTPAPEKKRMLRELTDDQRKMNNKKKATTKAVRDVLFQSPWFIGNAFDIIKEVIDESNDSPHNIFKQYTKREVEVYIQKIVRTSEALVVYKANTPEARAFDVTEENALQLVDREVDRTSVV